MKGVATEASQRFPLRSSRDHRAAATPTAAASAAAQSSWKQATGKASRGTSSVPMAQRLPKRRMAGMAALRIASAEKGKKREKRKNECPRRRRRRSTGKKSEDFFRGKKRKRRAYTFFDSLFYHPHSTPVNEQNPVERRRRRNCLDSIRTRRNRNDKGRLQELPQERDIESTSCLIRFNQSQWDHQLKMSSILQQPKCTISASLKPSVMESM